MPLIVEQDDAQLSRARLAGSFVHKIQIPRGKVVLRHAETENKDNCDNRCKVKSLGGGGEKNAAAGLDSAGANR
jgi:hypothetical protein